MLLIRNLLSALCLLAAAVIISACAPSTEENPLVVGMDLSYPPFESINPNGDPEGVSVELAKGLADFLGRPLKIENIPFVGLIPALQSGKVDVVISSMTRTAERSKSIAFSQPYLYTGLALLVAKDSPIQSPADLDPQHQRVVVRQGTTGEVWARDHFPSENILVVEKENAAVLEVLQGNVDAFIYDQMSVWKNADQHAQQLRAVLQPLQVEGWAVGIAKDRPELVTKVNEFLESYRSEGGFERLGDTYLKQTKEAFKKAGVPFVFDPPKN